MWKSWSKCGPALLLPNLQKAARHRMDLRMIVLGSGLGDYRRSVQNWWGKVEKAVAASNLWRTSHLFCQQ